MRNRGAAHDPIEPPSPFARLAEALEADAEFDVEGFLERQSDDAPLVARRLSRAVRAGFLRVGSHAMLERVEARYGIDVSTDASRASLRVGAGSNSAEEWIGERFRVIGRLGRGGMADVLRAVDVDLDRVVAIKIVRLDAASTSRTPADEQRVARLVQEAHITSRLEHPAIVPVYGRGVLPDGRPFFAMKIVDGDTLLERIESGRGLPPTEAVRIALRVCEALEYAHGRGVIHRDVTPMNVMLGEFGEVQLMDWGLARELDATRLVDAAVAERDAPVLRVTRMTQDGAVFGTPSYMSPEQARGDSSAIEARTDVFGVGAILCHAISGAPPYHGRSSGELLERARVGARNDPALTRTSRRVPPALVAICDKAMSPDPEHRYRSMRELGDDLRAFLDRRVVRAYERGALAELRMWARRNRGAALALSLTFAALAVAALALDARRREVAAAVESGQRTALGIRSLQRLRSDADELWPLNEAQIPRLRAWLEAVERPPADLAPASGDAIDIAQRAAEIEARAVPASAEERERDARAHPRYAELETLRAQMACFDANVTARARGVAVRVDDPSFLAGAVQIGEHATPSEELDRASRLVHPEKREFGSELEGLLLALRAVRDVEDSERARAHYVLAQAYFVNGHDVLARQSLRTAYELGSETQRATLEKQIPHLDQMIREHGPAGAPEPTPFLTEFRARLQALEAEVEARDKLRFASVEDSWWYANYLDWIAVRRALFDERSGIAWGADVDQGWSVRRRLTFLEERQRALASDPALRAQWADAIAFVRAVPSANACALTPQLDLLPLGRDPWSGLYEFAHLPSGRPPVRDADGHWIIDGDTSMVFVLVPGGDAILGAQTVDPDAPHFDPRASSADGSIQRVALDPFFVSKYETTRGQWRRLTGRDPSYFSELRDNIFTKSDRRNPVENVAWSEALRQLERFGLALPTEAQWEYAARAGTDTPWYSGSDVRSIAGCANLADRSLVGAGVQPPIPYDDWLDDGASITARVGAYRPNAFGLHDTIGNVFEMTCDGFGSYGNQPRRGDGKFEGEEGMNHAIRGGSMQETADGARVTRRLVESCDDRSYLVGIRPVRALSQRP